MKEDDDETTPWPRKYGHSPQYFESLLLESDGEARRFGIEFGLTCATFFGGLTYIASKAPPDVLWAHGISKQAFGPSFRGINRVHIAAVAIFAGLIGSQFATHYHYQLAYDRINEQRKREAFFRSEAKRRGEF